MRFYLESMTGGGEEAFMTQAYSVYKNANDFQKTKGVLEKMIEMHSKRDEVESVFALDKAYSELAWNLYSAEESIPSKDVILEVTSYITKAIELNGSNIEAQVRLGTLIHLFGHSHLADVQIPQKSE